MPKKIKSMTLLRSQGRGPVGDAKPFLKRVSKKKRIGAKERIKRTGKRAVRG